VASSLNLFRNGAVGFIDWLDGVLPRKTGFNDFQCAPGDIVANLDAEACATTHDVLPPVSGTEVWHKVDAHTPFARTLNRHFIRWTLRQFNSVVAQVAVNRFAAVSLSALVFLKLTQRHCNGLSVPSANLYGGILRRWFLCVCPVKEQINTESMKRRGMEAI
jgi:hypothetical protein